MKYLGLKSNWDLIEKYKVYWAYKTPTFTVECLDESFLENQKK